MSLTIKARCDIERRIEDSVNSTASIHVFSFPWPQQRQRTVNREVNRALYSSPISKLICTAEASHAVRNVQSNATI